MAGRELALMLLMVVEVTGTWRRSRSVAWGCVLVSPQPCGTSLSCVVVGEVVKVQGGQMLRGHIR